jgi:hypothetical protein
MKKQIISLILILFISFALTLEVSEELNTNVIVHEFNEPIEMKLAVTNATSGLYNVYTLSDIIITPSEIFEQGNGDFERTFYLSKNERLDLEGYYVFTYTLNHRNHEQISKKLTLNLVNLEDVVEIYTEVITLNDTKVTVRIKNKEEVNLRNLEAKFSSVVFDGESTFSLGPLEEKILIFDLDENKLKKTRAGTYIIDTTFIVDEEKVNANGKLYINEQKGIRAEIDSSGIFIRTNRINKINAGNTVETVEVEIEKNIISRLFTSFNLNPDETIREGARVKLIWREKLYPSANLNVVVKTNWFIPFLIVIALLVSFFGIKRLIEKKILIKKSVTLMGTKKGEFALKVTLNLKATKDIENLSLVDRIPRMLKLYNKFGTTKPDKIDAHNRKVQWNIGDLASGEERVFSYVIYSKIGILGKISLPSARAIFEVGEKLEEVNSDKVFFMSSQAETDR